MWVVIVALALCLSFVRGDDSCDHGKSLLTVTSLEDYVTSDVWSHLTLYDGIQSNATTVPALDKADSRSSSNYCVEKDKDYLLVLDEKSVHEIKICDDTIVRPGHNFFVRLTASDACVVIVSSFEDDTLVKDPDTSVVTDSIGSKDTMEMPYITVSIKFDTYNQSPTLDDINAMVSVVARAQEVVPSYVDSVTLRQSEGQLKTRTRLPLSDGADLNSAYHRVFAYLTDTTCSGKFTQSFQSSGHTAFSKVNVLSVEISSHVQRLVRRNNWTVEKLFDSNVWRVDSSDDMIALMCENRLQLESKKVVVANSYRNVLEVSYVWSVLLCLVVVVICLLCYQSVQERIMIKNLAVTKMPTEDSVNDDSLLV